jgi:hypothetical protein
MLELRSRLQFHNILNLALRNQPKSSEVVTIIIVRLDPPYLGIMDSIWGNSEAVSNFHDNNNVWAHEIINGIQFVERSGSLTFMP